MVVAGALLISVLAQGGESIDWNRARELRQKEQRGATLTPDERAYLDRALAARSRREQPPGGRRQGASGPAPREQTGLVPLTEMVDAYQGRDGGLYGGGRNEPPAAHARAAQTEARRIVPLDVAGRAAPDGKIVLLSVGMSNTTQEFSRFVEIAARDPRKAANVVLVDGAQGGQAAAEWARTRDSAIWQTVGARLRAAGVTPAMVQVAWIKQANPRPTEPFPAHAEKLAEDLAGIVRLLKQAFPHLRLAYLSSRTFGGYATTPLNPEPVAYESAFAVRDVILRQIGGEAALNFDPAEGAVNAPVVLWGPYLWADGTTARQADGLVWQRGDFREDGTHPSATSGRDKVARMLLDFFTTEKTARPWFVAAPER
jgi:hypothetical protein